jgi:hypothetical protein
MYLTGKLGHYYWLYCCTLLCVGRYRLIRRNAVKGSLFRGNSESQRRESQKTCTFTDEEQEIQRHMWPKNLMQYEWATPQYKPL